MQALFVKAAQKQLAAAIKARPTSTQLRKVSDYLSAVLKNDRTALIKAEKALIALALSDLNQLIDLKSDFWVLVLMIVSFSGDYARFDNLLTWAVKDFITRDPVVETWKDLGELIKNIPGADAVDKKKLSEGFDDWRGTTKIVVARVTAMENARPQADRKKPLPDSALLAVLKEMHRQAARMAMLYVGALFEQARAELEAGKEPTLLRTLLRALISFRTDGGSLLQLEDTQVDAKQTSFVDYFPGSKRKFSGGGFDILKPEILVPRSHALLTVIEARIAQIAFLLRLHGFNPDVAAAPTVAEKARRKRFDRMKRPIAIADHDNFVRVLVALFLEAHEPLAAKPGLAIMAGWYAVLRTIYDYLAAFTSHPIYNLSDDGPNYLITDFPRTAGGELLHDCGVYAVCIAYWLLNMEAAILHDSKIDLGLTVEYVALPIHVGLLVSLAPPVIPKTADGLPAGAAVWQNAVLKTFEAGDLKGRCQKWVSDRPPGDIDPTDLVDRAHKFLVDLAASAYIGNVDTVVSSKVVITKKQRPTKPAVWTSYFDYTNKDPAGQLFTKEAAGTSGKYAQFFLRYDVIGKADAEFVNATMLNEFWRNRAPRLYDDTFKKKPWGDRGSLANLKDYTPKMEALRLDYKKKAIDFRSKKGTDGRNPRLAIFEDLEKDAAKIISKSARRVFSERIHFDDLDDAMLSFVARIEDHDAKCKAVFDTKHPAPWPPPPPFLLSAEKEIAY